MVAPAARRLIAIVCAALVVLAVVGALVYSFQPTGNGCGSGWAAARKPIPSPLLTEEEKQLIARDRLQPYEFGLAKQLPIEECRRAGSRRLISAGLGALVVLIPAGAILAFLYWPRREDLVDEYEVVGAPDEPDGPNSVPPKRTDWAGR